jgi:cytochrome b
MSTTSLDSLSRPARRDVRVWDLPTRLFHWLLVAAIAAAFLSAESDSPLAAWHQTAGWIAGLLIVFRLVWGVVGGEHARFTDFLHLNRIGAHLRAVLRREPQPDLGHNPVGGLAVLAILALVAASVVTGVTLARSGGEELHEAVAYGLLVVAGVHLAGVVAMSFLGRENLIRAMVTGAKPAARHQGAADARPAPWFALPLAVLAVAAAAYGATRIDPGAFGPHVGAESRSTPPTGQAETGDDD